MIITENGKVTVNSAGLVLIESFTFSGECMGNMRDGAILAMKRAIEILEQEIKAHETIT